MIINEKDYLAHYGTPRHSGRYPWGSGGNSIRSQDFLDMIDGMRKDGLKDTEIAKGLGITTTQLRARRTIALNERKHANINMAQQLRDKGWGPTAIGERMGQPESTIRSWLEPGAKVRADILNTTVNSLKNQVAAKKYIDVGSGVEAHLGITATKLRAAVAVLQEQGYQVHALNQEQLGTGKDTRRKVLVGPETTYGDLSRNREKIAQPFEYTEDGGQTFLGIDKPLSIHPDRVAVKYGDEGGREADGVIYARPGVDDISIGNGNYAQVRIQVGDSHYLKGMVMYRDDLPDGVDLLFNTNKENTGNKLDALKPIEKDPDNPFGSYIRRQIHETDANGNIITDSKGNRKVKSAMNLVNEEGNWGDWSNSIATQVVSKQNKKLIEEQLNLTFAKRQREYDEINALTNPVVKKKLLEEFAEGTDAAAVHLKTAGFPRQGWHAILPINDMSPTEIYAPNFRPGERVVLIRYPHGGIFEIPELTVNNNHPTAKKLLGNAKDAVGIHHKVAEQLSGADFDGDTVLVIPNNNRKIKHSPPLEALKGFDPKLSYPYYDGMKVMKNTQAAMGSISNLITDMTIQGAKHSEIARAVKHSMVIIDGEKHKLDYKRSAEVNNIRQLHEKYQSSGASTLISRAKGRIDVPHRKDRPAKEGGPIDKATGKRVYVETGEISYKTGKPRMIKSKKLAETDDAHTLSSGTPQEELYANYSNKMKALANKARKTAVNTPRLERSPSAAKTYAKEVESLDAKLNLAVRNRPLERQAQTIAKHVIKLKKQDNPSMDEDMYRKIKFQALEAARQRVGAKPNKIEITPNEWDAIQQGAISTNKLTQILNKADMTIVRQLATPRKELLLSPSKVTRARAMLNSGRTRAEVADALGVSISTLERGVNG